MIEAIKKTTRAAAERRGLSPENFHVAAGEWIVISEPTREELEFLSEKYKLKPGNLTDALDIDEMPRLDHDAHYGYLYVRRPYAHKDGSTTTRPLLIIYGAENLITLFPKTPEFLDSFLGADSDFSTRGTQAIALKLLAQVFSDYDSYIKAQSQKIKSNINKMRAHRLESSDFTQFVTLEDQINNFLSALTPMVPLLNRVATSRLAQTDSERDALEDITLAIEQAVHLCNTNIARIVSIREAYATLSNNSLNRTMKTLTLATLLIAAPNLIFGMYGMNVHLPFQWADWGYWFALGIALILIVVVITWAHRRRLF